MRVQAFFLAGKRSPAAVFSCLFLCFSTAELLTTILKKVYRKPANINIAISTRKLFKCDFSADTCLRKSHKLNNVCGTNASFCCGSKSTKSAKVSAKGCVGSCGGFRPFSLYAVPRHVLRLLHFLIFPQTFDNRFIEIHLVRQKICRFRPVDDSCSLPGNVLLKC